MTVCKIAISILIIWTLMLGPFLIFITNEIDETMKLIIKGFILLSSIALISAIIGGLQ